MDEREALSAVVYQKLIKYGLLSAGHEIYLWPCHAIAVRGKQYSHFIISGSKTARKFFLKVMKPNDCAPHCNEYLQKIRDNDGKCPYPIILVPAFCFHDVYYYITNYVDGQVLDMLPETLPEDFWGAIADKLRLRYNELLSIRAPHYSERGKFILDDCASIFLQKFAEKLRYPDIPLSEDKRRLAFDWCCVVMENCAFSEPTLLHMDIKPGNIVYDPARDSVSLIDFEFARFGDADYGWTQLLLSGINCFSSIYKKQIVPRVIRDRPTLQEALNIPKYRCYLFYQLICNFIYYNRRKMRCPGEMTALFERLAGQL